LASLGELSPAIHTEINNQQIWGSYKSLNEKDSFRESLQNPDK